MKMSRLIPDIPILLLIVALAFSPVAFAKSVYTLERTVIVWEDGTTIDTYNDDEIWHAYGFMVIDGEEVRQHTDICRYDVCRNAVSKGDVLQLASNSSRVKILNANGQSSDVVLLSLYPLITLTRAAGYIEVDTWITSPGSGSGLDPGGPYETNVGAAMGVGANELH